MQSRPLFSRKAIPGWAMLTWDIIGILARLEWMGKKMNALWTFFTSPLGNIVLLIAGLLWLTAITVLPKLRKRVTVPAAEPPQRVGLEASTFRHLEVAFENLTLPQQYALKLMLASARAQSYIPRDELELALT